MIVTSTLWNNIQYNLLYLSKNNSFSLLFVWFEFVFRVCSNLVESSCNHPASANSLANEGQFTLKNPNYVQIL
jgi:hypothetical protein